MKKKIILIITVLLILLIGCILLIIQNNKQNNNYYEYSQEPDERYTKRKEKYEYNEFQFASVSMEDLLKLYFNKYKNECNMDVENSYEMLDYDYREKRFGSLEKYEEYLANNLESINTAVLYKYSKDQIGNDYNIYTCIDENGNYYIFKEVAIMDYSIMLDQYTIPSQSFINKYNQANEQGKVVLNIKKIVDSLNSKNYYYAYNCLSEGFKSNYFQTQQDFENYVKSNLFDGNFTIQYGKFDVESGLFKYTITIINNENTQEKVQKTIIMKLNEGTDFEMSFNV